MTLLPTSLTIANDTYWYADDNEVGAIGTTYDYQIWSTGGSVLLEEIPDRSVNSEGEVSVPIENRKGQTVRILRRLSGTNDEWIEVKSAHLIPSDNHWYKDDKDLGPLWTKYDYQIWSNGIAVLLDSIPNKSVNSDGEVKLEITNCAGQTIQILRRLSGTSGDWTTVEPSLSIANDTHWYTDDNGVGAIGTTYDYQLWSRGTIDDDNPNT